MNQGTTTSNTNVIAQGKLDMDQITIRTIEQFEELVRRGRDIHRAVFTSKVVGEIRQRFNAGNRRYDEITAQKYRRDMEAGRWMPDREVGFGVIDGRIQIGNGQHRFGGQAASGTDQRYTVRVFTDPDDFALYVITCDAGRVRTLADYLSLFGVAPNSGAAALFQRIVNAMQTFVGERPTRLSPQERMDFSLQYAKSIKYVLGLPRRDFKAHLLAAIALAHARRKDAVAEFIGRVTVGADLAIGSPELELKTHLPAMNATNVAKEKDRAMGRLLRVIFDAVEGKRRTFIHQTKPESQVMRDAIAALTSREIADMWVARQTDKRQDRRVNA
ncbi:MAG TPA: hypothetical protein VFT22_10985 [Kofleriaceae bacterium]|nr:hypothetical protein [Kofleriaceae bacterium]